MNYDIKVITNNNLDINYGNINKNYGNNINKTSIFRTLEERGIIEKNLFRISSNSSNKMNLFDLNSFCSCKLIY